jgi:hypothetical protein|tara:strand:+ start:7249 stop:7773 length:525 start_codon:yes stop_codon:yes gene_type:complete
MKKGDKKGQFYLLATIIIVTIVASLVIVSNYSTEKTNIKFNHLGKELEIESRNVIDYGIKNNENIKDLLIDFTKNYSIYSTAESLYFIFGNDDEVTISGYKKLNSEVVVINTGSGNEDFSLNKEEYKSQSFSDPTENIKIKVGEIDYDFTLNSGENFYFIISKEIDGEKHIFTK